ncbi:hypothetical protein EIP91_006486 [Steccherinum ochraceum]|uniref:Ribonuclease P protein subunit n=1 Tax=Steccherinum ochraceum TaxID=92696 RepID=A0A4R0RV82_9APHY|nr:hypothetical protein EIP91_006486 [Steccherinum ochraceum]
MSYAGQQQADIYTDLYPTDRVRLSSQTPFTPRFVQENVTRSSDPAHVYASRVQGRQLLLDNPSRDSAAAKKKRESKKTRKTSQKAGVVGSKELGSKAVWKLTATKFKSFLPLHQLWLDYMSELLGLSNAPPSLPGKVDDSAMPSTATMHAKLVKADLHGAFITVKQSKNPCLVGLSGVVIHETENAFKIVTRADKMRLIPKPNSIFVLKVPLYSTQAPEHQQPAASTSTSGSPEVSDVAQTKIVQDIPHIEFDLYGNQFCFRSADRASRKFKPKETIEL